MDTLIGTTFFSGPWSQEYEYTVRMAYNGVNENNKGMQARLVTHAKNPHLFYMGDMPSNCLDGRYAGTFTVQNGAFVRIGD